MNNQLMNQSLKFKFNSPQNTNNRRLITDHSKQESKCSCTLHKRSFKPKLNINIPVGHNFNNLDKTEGSLHTSRSTYTFQNISNNYSIKEKSLGNKTARNKRSQRKIENLQTEVLKEQNLKEEDLKEPKPSEIIPPKETQIKTEPTPIPTPIFNDKLNNSDKKLSFILDNLGLNELMDDFQSKKINFADFLMLNDEDLEELKLPFGPKKRILKFNSSYNQYAKVYSMSELKMFFRTNKNLVVKNIINDNSIYSNESGSKNQSSKKSEDSGSKPNESGISYYNNIYINTSSPNLNNQIYKLENSSSDEPSNKKINKQLFLYTPIYSNNQYDTISSFCKTDIEDIIKEEKEEDENEKTEENERKGRVLKTEG
ncbi:MAG: hypothetical protein MJ252_20060, partial [archaeon]|nr:hypothetical protein [archaeon]